MELAAVPLVVDRVFLVRGCLLQESNGLASLEEDNPVVPLVLERNQVVQQHELLIP